MPRRPWRCSCRGELRCVVCRPRSWPSSGGAAPPRSPPSGPPEPCLVIWPRCTMVSDSWCRGVSPAQLASRVGSGKRRRRRSRRRRPPPRIGPTLYRLVAGVGFQPRWSWLPRVDLDIERVDQPQQRLHPGPCRRRQRDPASSLKPPRPNRSLTGTIHPAQRAPRGPGPRNPERRCTSLARWRTSSRNSRTPAGRSRLRAAVACAAGQQDQRVTFVVLHPPVGEGLHPQRVRQCTRPTQLGQRVGGPVVG